MANYLTAIKYFDEQLRNEKLVLELNQELIKNNKEYRLFKVKHLLGLLAYKLYKEEYVNSPIELFVKLKELADENNFLQLVTYCDS